ncbi:MAG TPA: hypothetical protein VFT22_07380 [Kofleriaceae bacterium]|nr:hypothetical protein [Kofleriaceae bacterium]
MRSARREQGVAEWTHAGGQQLARPTFTCCHCGNVTIVPERARAEDCGGFCRQCMKPTCTSCADKGCTPFEREIERQEARGRLLAAMGL